MILTSFLIFVCVQHISALTANYYWKDYTGDVPQDAFKAGKNVYIGQAYIHNHGLAVVRISPGNRIVDAPMYGVKRSSIIKILCIPDGNHFQWLPTNATHLHIDTIEKYPVIGGYDLTNKNGLLYIGRIMYQGEIQFGSVAAYDLKNSPLYFPYDNVEKNVNIYEVLIYNEKVPVDVKSWK